MARNTFIREDSSKMYSGKSFEQNVEPNQSVDLFLVLPPFCYYQEPYLLWLNSYQKSLTVSPVVSFT